jgi:precorrin-6B methylase 2
MDARPDDIEARRELLGRWGTEQQQRIWEAEWGLDNPPGWVRKWTTVARAKARRGVVGAGVRFVDRVLDRGLDTSDESRQPEHSKRDRVRYVPSPWYVIPRELRYLGVTDRDVFVDFGCGKGRVVHQAARWPFSRVIGLEISPVLAEIARANLAARSRQHRCQNIEIVVGDAAEYRVPDDLTIGYIFHPFGGQTLDAMLQAIVDSIDRRPRRVRLIYTYPWAAAQVLATGRFRLMRERRPFSRDYPYSRVSVFESCAPLESPLSTHPSPSSR